MMSKAYAYAVIPSRGMYGSGDSVRVRYRTDDREKALAEATRRTAIYQREMRPYGGSSGGFRAIRWDSDDDTISLGHDADRMPSITDGDECEHDWHHGGKINGQTIYDCQSCGATRRE